MNIRIPASGKAAKIAKAFLKTQGIELKHAQALELVARLHGYTDNQAMQNDVNFQDPLGLAAEGSTDFVFKGARNSSIWITVENISVYVKRADEGVIVDLYKKGNEDDESLAGTYLEYNEAMDACDTCGCELDEHGFCTDETCFHSDWPQEVIREDVESMSTADVEAKYGVEERKRVDFRESFVNWSCLSDETDIDTLQFDKNAPRQISYSNERYFLSGLVAVPGSTEEEKLNSPAFEYTVADAHGKTQAVAIKALLGAVEVEPGVIKLADGRILRLLSQSETGEYRVFSPELLEYLPY